MSHVSVQGHSSITGPAFSNYGTMSRLSSAWLSRASPRLVLGAEVDANVEVPASDGGPAHTLLNICCGLAIPALIEPKASQLERPPCFREHTLRPLFPMSLAQMTIPLELSRLRPTKRLSSAS